jgi:Xaa-Pro aminopeptidase
MTEFDRKQQRIQTFLGERDLDALLLQRVSSFAWATCGAASYVNTATSTGEATLLITRSGRHLITNSIEAPRLEQEEKLAEQGWEFHVGRWYEAHSTLAELTQGMRLAADGSYPGAANLSGDLARLRANLTPEEGERFRALGRLCAEAMDQAARAIRPGQTEYQIAGLLAREAESRGAQAVVNLIATDERVFAFRHPLPTAKKLERYAMLVLCGRRWGLVCSITRFVHFGSLPDDVRRKAEAVARIDATFIAATRPGHTLGQIFRRATEAYAAAGFPDEWHLHHQGGPAGYEPREYVATPDSADVVSIGQVYAWNPSITGTKSEDTILVGDAGNEVLTSIDGWPTLTVTVDDLEYVRPAIMEIL